MTIRDFRSAQDSMLLQADIAVVGGGPVGITIAREFANTSIQVLVIDSGGLDFEPDVQALNAVENVGEPFPRKDVEPIGRGYANGLKWLNDIPAFELRNRLLGGSTHTWVGKCAAFDEIDFMSRSWLPLSGWPIARADLQDALSRAGELLNLGPNLYDERLYKHLHSPPRDLGIDRSHLRPFFWQFSHERDQRGEPMRFNRHAREMDAKNIDFLTHATVTDINLDANGRRATSLEIAGLDGKRAVVRAETIVLCGGGIENARLLLASNKQMKTGIGNGRDVVGRYLADHPRTSLARVTGDDIDAVAEHFNFYGLIHKRHTHFYLQGLSLSPEIQAREGLTNCATYPVQIHHSSDPWSALKRVAHGSRKTLVSDLATIGRSSGMIASGLYSRLICKRGLPHRSVELRFDVMAEQQLDAESRVTLSERRDRFGRPLPKVDWKIGSTEIRSMKRLAQLMAQEFRRIGLPSPQLVDWIADDDIDKAAFMDMAHPSCTTRMGTDPATSVVDADSMVHGIDGLFVAGSSVFPTGGHANPTLMLLTLAIRLADHIKARHAAARSDSGGGYASRMPEKTARSEIGRLFAIV
ncbi:MAG: GMC family oxidoreductase [Rhizobiaceae bacterium]|nr:GMC family oxidoreductase [Rhizobiaceae bacterium]